MVNEILPTWEKNKGIIVGKNLCYTTTIHNMWGIIIMDLISAFNVVQMLIHSVPNQICTFQYLMSTKLYGHSYVHDEYLDTFRILRFIAFCFYISVAIWIQYVQVIVKIYTCLVKATIVNLMKICNHSHLHILHNNNNNNNNNNGWNVKFGNEK